MNKRPGVVLKPGRDKAIRQHHHWIFSGAIRTFPVFEDGEILPVYSIEGQLLGHGYFNRRSGITGRMLSFDATPPLEALEQRLEAALQLRKQLFKDGRTNAYRLVNGEGDGIPGLVLDLYNQVVVLQSSTLGMDRLKPMIIDWIKRCLNPKTIYEKSNIPSRREEGLEEVEGYLYGVEEGAISFMENRLQFRASLPQSQKNRFFSRSKRNASVGKRAFLWKTGSQCLFLYGGIYNLSPCWRRHFCGFGRYFKRGD